MFSLQPDDELVFGTPITSHGDQIPDDLIADHAFVESKIISFGSSGSGRQLGQTKKFGFPQRQTESRNECDIRKAMHRDIERKRRQEISNLYFSLHSLLPLQHNKGKRSACDLVQKAVNHIEQMQKNIQELRLRRDKLKELSSSGGTNIESSIDTDELSNCVTVNLAQDGWEILISCSIKSSDFWLSSILAELVGMEFDVVSSVSTRTRGGFLHKIHVEARDMTSLDVSVLQNRLANAMK